MINVGKDRSMNNPNKPGIAHFDSCEKAWNYLEDLENEPLNTDIIDMPITVHNIQSIRQFLKRGIKLLPSKTERQKMLRYILTSRLFGASVEDILRSPKINMKVTKDSIAQMRGYELEAFNRVKDEIAKTKYEGIIPIIGSASPFEDRKRKVL